MILTFLCIYSAYKLKHIIGVFVILKLHLSNFQKLKINELISKVSTFRSSFFNINERFRYVTIIKKYDRSRSDNLCVTSCTCKLNWN